MTCLLKLLVRQNLQKPFFYSWHARRALCQTCVLHAGEKEKFVRDHRPHINLATLGASEHGKTALTASITQVLAKQRSDVEPKTIDDLYSKSEKLAGHTQLAHHVGYNTDRYHYALTDLPGMQTYIRNVIPYLSLLDGVLLVISAEQGIVPDTIIHYHLAKHFKIHILPVLNVTPDTDSDSLEVVQMDMEDLLTKKEMNDTVSGSVTDDKFIQTLLGGMDESPSLQYAADQRQTDSTPLYWPIEQAGTIPYRGTFIAGRLMKGSVSVGQSVDFIYQGITSKGKVRDLEIFRKQVDSRLEAGDRGGAFINFKKEPELKRGAVVCNDGVPEGMQSSLMWTVSVQVLPGTSEPVSFKTEWMCFHRTYSDGKALLSSRETLPPGETIETMLTLRYPLLGKQGDPLVLRSSNPGNPLLIANLVKPDK